ncbi:MAG TPA: hypothetical protein PLY80_09255 [Pseudomonadota bacterium]|nr:hypothetical protein [Pseudomonadota bacterium]
MANFAKLRLGLALWFGLGWTAAARGQTPPAASDATASASAPSSAQAQSEPVPSETTAWDLALEGRKLLKAKDIAGAIAKFQAALARADHDELAADDRALIAYLLSLAASNSGNDELSLSAIRDAVKYAPKEADYQLELANQLFANDENLEAKLHVEEALKIGLSSDDDRKDAEALLQKTKTAMLHERLSIDLSVTTGYDSNVIQGGQAETIGGVPTGARQTTTSTQAFREQLRQRNLDLLKSLLTNYKEAIATNYREAVPSVSEYDIPVTVGLDLGGRLYGNRTTALWTGYRFTQLFMTSPSNDHDSYSLQEHVIPLRLEWRPRSWFLFRPRIEGYANFTGLKTFAPFQGGVTAVLDFLFTESRRWRTRVLGTYQLRQSFDRTYSYLDGNRIDAKVVQELRINQGGSVWARGQLSYRFRADLSGVIEQSVDLQVLSLRGEPITVGSYDYKNPLSYLGNEVGTRWRLYVPKGFDLGIGASLDLRSYRDATTAVYSASPLTINCPAATTAPNCPAGTTVTVPRDGTTTLDLPATVRRDSLLSVDAGITKTLPAGFSIDLTVTFMRNVSNIANGIDNRNYSKLTTMLGIYYSF